MRPLLGAVGVLVLAVLPAFVSSFGMTAPMLLFCVGVCTLLPLLLCVHTVSPHSVIVITNTYTGMRKVLNPGMHFTTPLWRACSHTWTIRETIRGGTKTKTDSGTHLPMRVQSMDIAPVACNFSSDDKASIDTWVTWRITDPLLAVAVDDLPRHIETHAATAIVNAATVSASAEVRADRSAFSGTLRRCLDEFADALAFDYGVVVESISVQTITYDTTLQLLHAKTAEDSAVHERAIANADQQFAVTGEALRETALRSIALRVERETNARLEVDIFERMELAKRGQLVAEIAALTEAGFTLHQLTRFMHQRELAAALAAAQSITVRPEMIGLWDSYGG